MNALKKLLRLMFPPKEHRQPTVEGDIYAHDLNMINYLVPTCPICGGHIHKHDYETHKNNFKCIS